MYTNLSLWLSALTRQHICCIVYWVNQWDFIITVFHLHGVHKILSERSLFVDFSAIDIYLTVFHVTFEQPLLSQLNLILIFWPLLFLVYTILFSTLSFQFFMMHPTNDHTGSLSRKCNHIPTISTYLGRSYNYHKIHPVIKFGDNLYFNYLSWTFSDAYVVTEEI